jgi:hypothetical protein
MVETAAAPIEHKGRQQATKARCGQWRKGDTGAADAERNITADHAADGAASDDGKRQQRDVEACVARSCSVGGEERRHEGPEGVQLHICPKWPKDDALKPDDRKIVAKDLGSNFAPATRYGPSSTSTYIKNPPRTAIADTPSITVCQGRD